ncbi:MAG: DNA lyase [Methanobacterium sp.]|nr:DNA lyase [Methanobacterium sp.]
MIDQFQINSADFPGPINLDLTMNSGQTSQPAWKINNGFFEELIMVDDQPFLVKIRNSSLDEDGPLDVEIESSEEIGRNKIKKSLFDIFGLNDDLNSLYAFLGTDPKLNPTIEFCHGLRIFKAHNPFECLISSISSANNSIIRWSRSIRQMEKKWGNKYRFSSGDYFSFPSPYKILEVPEHEVEELELCGGEKDLEECVNNLKACGVGYRGKYIKEASRMVIEDIDLDEIAKMDYDEAFQTLLQIPGVGPKVADCILLYGFGRGEAFPVDVWIKRIICQLYFDGKDVSVPKIRLFGREEYGKYAGYVQLYLFHYARKSGLMKTLK